MKRVWGVLVSVHPAWYLSEYSAQERPHLHGGPIQKDAEASLDLLTQLLRFTPSLEELAIIDNDFHDLPACFINDLIFHPNLRLFDPTGNDRLGCSLDRSTPCAIHRLLSQVCIAASSSHFTLRGLCLQCLGLTADCCGPVLETGAFPWIKRSSRYVSRLQSCSFIPCSDSGSNHLEGQLLYPGFYLS